MKEAGITASRFSATDLYRPFWLEKVLTEHLCSAAYSPSLQEVEAAGRVLQRGGSALSKNRLKQAMGVKESRAIDSVVAAPQLRLSRDELLTILMRLDDVARTAPEAREERMSWLRDACAIGLAAWLGVSFNAVVQITLHKGRELERELSNLLEQPGEWQSAICLIHGWLASYLTQVRPRFEGYKHHHAKLFLSRFGVHYAGSGLPARFSALLRDCRLECWPRGARLLVGMPIRANSR
jgi:hypothetical protein